MISMVMQDASPSYDPHIHPLIHLLMSRLKWYNITWEGYPPASSFPYSTGPGRLGISCEDFWPGAIKRVNVMDAIFQALEENNIERVKEFISLGVNVNARHRNGLTLLHRASYRGLHELAEFLLARGAEVDARTNEGYTPLHVASSKGQVELVRLLISHGARMDAVATGGQTPLQCARDLNNTEIIGILQALEAPRKDGAFPELEQFGDLPPMEPSTPVPQENLMPAREATAGSAAQFRKMVCLTGRKSLEARTDINSLLTYAGAARDIILHCVSTLQLEEDQKLAVAFSLAPGEAPGVTLTASSLPASLEELYGKLRTLDVPPVAQGPLRFLLLFSAPVTAGVSSEPHRDVFSEAPVIDIRARDDEGKTRLHEAAVSGNIPLASTLLAQGADVNAQDNGGWTPLHRAAFSGQVRFAELIIARGANFNAQDAGGKTPLHKAVGSAHREMVDLLILKGADVNLKDNAGITPLRLAEERNSRQIAEALRARGAVSAVALKIEKAPPGKPAASELFKAIESGDLAAVQAIVTSNEAVDLDRPILGKPPLHWAAGKNRLKIADYLLSQGASLDGEDDDGRTPLHIAAMEGRNEAAEFMLSRGAQLDRKEVNGLTPLHRASEMGYTSIVAMLLARGADINVKGSRGETPLHWASYKGYRDTVEFLLSKGALINEEDDDGYTPLHWAEKDQRRDIAEVLKSQGAKKASLLNILKKSIAPK
jgi:serine/threonine-protein phosphatase 6 regulatory ankyrin repeat subunit A